MDDFLFPDLNYFNIPDYLTLQDVFIYAVLHHKQNERF